MRTTHGLVPLRSLTIPLTQKQHTNVWFGSRVLIAGDTHVSSNERGKTSEEVTFGSVCVDEVGQNLLFLFKPFSAAEWSLVERKNKRRVQQGAI